MAAVPVLTVGDGVIEIPQEFRNDPRLQKGAQLRLVSSTDGSLLMGSSSTKEKRTGDWRRLRGVLKELDVRLVDEMEAEERREIVADERMMRGTGAV